MGAADTFIAKPWRREVYVQAGGYPHPVLGHEVMHVIAGAFARGPFRIAGGAGGLLPDPSTARLRPRAARSRPSACGYANKRTATLAYTFCRACLPVSIVRSTVSPR